MHSPRNTCQHISGSRPETFGIVKGNHWERNICDSPSQDLPEKSELAQCKLARRSNQYQFQLSLSLLAPCAPEFECCAPQLQNHECQSQPSNFPPYKSPVFNIKKHTSHMNYGPSVRITTYAEPTIPQCCSPRVGFAQIYVPAFKGFATKPSFRCCGGHRPYFWWNFCII